MATSHIEQNTLRSLGDLEIAVLDLIWRDPGLSAKETHKKIGETRGISVNTVQSTLERLHRKQLLERTKKGHAFHYSARVTRERLVASLINDLVGRFSSDTTSSLAAFVEMADQLDEPSLQALESELKNRRQRSR